MNTYHIRIGDDPWCRWTGCAAGQSIMEKSGRVTCSHTSQRKALAAAKKLRPHFKRGRVRVFEGQCEEA